MCGIMTFPYYSDVEGAYAYTTCVHMIQFFLKKQQQ